MGPSQACMLTCVTTLFAFWYPYLCLRRVASIYIHLVDLVFVFIVFVVYGGNCSSYDEQLAAGKKPSPYSNRLISMGADGKVIDEDMI